MADAIVSEVVGRIATMLENKIRYEVNLVRGVKDELRYLSKKLNMIRKVLDDAEKRGVKDESVKSWLKKLEATAYEMDDILDEWNYSLLNHKMEASAEPELELEPKQKIGCSFIRCSCLCFKKVSVRPDIAKKIENVKAMLEQIYKERDDFKFVISPPTTDPVPVPESHREPSVSSIDFNDVYGSDIYTKRDDIVTNMMLNGGNTQILSIVGTGGLGKTTLAKLIFNHPHFEKDWLKIWVCVSDPFVVAVVAKNIVELVGTEKIPLNSDQKELALQKLRASISEKKFILVLDDVWTEDEDKWMDLKINLGYGAAGSKILVTTRNEGVAKMMGSLDEDIYHPKELNSEECWSLLRAKSLAGKSKEECEKFENVGKKIASKCKGLPLAAVVLGRLLRLKDLEGWRHVEKSEIWELDNEEVKLFPHLVLSYNELSPVLKRCFSYCAVYPKDHRIHVETLIEEWLAQGYLGSVSGNGAVELKGREYLKSLAMRSLFQDIEKSKSGEQIEWCKMHDIVHDFALFLRKNDEREKSCQVCDSSLVSHVQEYRSLSWESGPRGVERERSWKVCDCMKSLRVLRVQRIDSPISVGIDTLIHLRWLDCSCNSLSKDDLEIISRLYFLQTLVLLRCNLREIPREIGNLVQLRHLDLNDNLRLKEFPESICSLVELQILKIAYTHIICLPEAIGELRNLRTLQLRHFNVGNQYNKLGFLEKIHCRLIGILDLEIHCSSMSEMLELVEDARKTPLKTLLQKLKTLVISFVDEMNKTEQSSVSSMWMEVIEALVPHQSLNRLGISRYKGYRLPHLMSSPFNFIKGIRLEYLSEVSSLPAMGKLPFLEDLCISNVEQLMFVGREFLGIESSCDDVVIAFPKLKKLRFYSCNKWEEWEDITEEEEESAAISIMPCLTHLDIEWCESLKKLPHRLLHKVSSPLQSFSIYGSSELVKTYGEDKDKEVSDWRSIFQHNFTNPTASTEAETTTTTKGVDTEPAPAPTPTTEGTEEEESTSSNEESGELTKEVREETTVRKLRPRKELKPPDRYQDFVAK